MRMIKKLITKGLRVFGLQIRRVVSTDAEQHTNLFRTSEVPYVERAEYGPSNIETKLANVAKGLPFDYADMLNLNKTVIGLVGDAKRICELGCGTGNFAVGASEAEEGRYVVACEFDEPTFRWVTENKERSNVHYVHGRVRDTDGPFDLVVSIEVIEHVHDYVGFLHECQRIAPRALITTPNRSRNSESYHSGPPSYFKHVREWTAGEFYWVLRAFYEKVMLYGLTSQTAPEYVAVNVDTRLSPLIADCRGPVDHMRSVKKFDRF